MGFTVVMCNRKIQKFEGLLKDTCRTAPTCALQGCASANHLVAKNAVHKSVRRSVCAEIGEGGLWDAHSRNVFQTRATFNIVPYSLPWSRLQLLHSVLTSTTCLIRGLKRRFDHISPVLIDLHWLPYPQKHLIM